MSVLLSRRRWTTVGLGSRDEQRCVCFEEATVKGWFPISHVLGREERLVLVHLQPEKGTPRLTANGIFREFFRLELGK